MQGGSRRPAAGTAAGAGGADCELAALQTELAAATATIAHLAVQLETAKECRTHAEHRAEAAEEAVQQFRRALAEGREQCWNCRWGERDEARRGGPSVDPAAAAPPRGETSTVAAASCANDCAAATGENSSSSEGSGGAREGADCGAWLGSTDLDGDGVSCELRLGAASMDAADVVARCAVSAADDMAGDTHDVRRAAEAVGDGGFVADAVGGAPVRAADAARGDAASVGQATAAVGDKRGRDAAEGQGAGRVSAMRETVAEDCAAGEIAVARSLSLSVLLRLQAVGVA